MPLFFKFAHLNELLDRLRIENRILKYFSLLGFLFLAVFGLLSYTVDSEIWSIHLAQYFGQSGHYQYSVYNKPLFYLILKALYFFPLTSLQHFIFAKVLFTLNGILLTYFCFRIFQLIVRDSSSAWAGLFFLLINPTWLSECFRIRADLLAMSFSLGALWLGLASSKKINLGVVIGILCLLLFSFLSTPKSFVWNFPLGVFLLIAAWGMGRRLKFVLLIMLTMTAILLVVLAMKVEEIHQALEIGWRHFGESQKSYLLSGWNYFAVDWLLVFNSIFATPVIWAVIFFSLVWFVGKNNFSSRKLKFALVLSYGFLGVSFFFYSPKLSFFWGALVPLLVLPSAWLWDRYQQKIAISVRVAILAVALISQLYWMFQIFIHQNGLPTYQFVSDLEDFVGEKKIRIFDSMGLMSRNQTIAAFVGAADSVGNEASILAVRQNPPDLILNTSRVSAYASDLVKELIETGDYVEANPGVWLRREAFHQELLGVDFIKITTVEQMSELFNQRVLWRP